MNRSFRWLELKRWGNRRRSGVFCSQILKISLNVFGETHSCRNTFVLFPMLFFASTEKSQTQSFILMKRCQISCLTQVCCSDGHTVCLWWSSLLCCFSLLHLFCFFSDSFTGSSSFASVCSLLPASLWSLPSLCFTVCFLFLLVDVSLTQIFFLFHSSHLFFTSLSSSSFLLGSLLTLLNVRAQTSPCRAAPSHKGQKQLVSLPFPCFLAASACLSVCLSVRHPPPHPSIHQLSAAGWSLNLHLKQSCSAEEFILIHTSPERETAPFFTISEDDDLCGWRVPVKNEHV